MTAAWSTFITHWIKFTIEYTCFLLFYTLNSLINIFCSRFKAVPWKWERSMVKKVRGNWAKIPFLWTIRSASTFSTFSPSTKKEEKNKRSWENWSKDRRTFRNDKACCLTSNFSFSPGIIYHLAVYHAQYILCMYFSKTCVTQTTPANYKFHFIWITQIPSKHNFN